MEAITEGITAPGGVVGGGVGVGLHSLKRSELHPLIGASSVSHTSILSNNNPVNNAITGDTMSEMDYYLPYNTNNHKQTLPAALLGTIHASDNLIVAPVFKLQNTFTGKSNKQNNKVSSFIIPKLIFFT